MLSTIMQRPRYSLVAYLRNPVGDFVLQLRRELAPQLPHLAAHVTVLPPRHIEGDEASALESIAEICGEVDPFEFELGDMESFFPTTPTVFIRVARAAYRIRELHDRLNRDSLPAREEWLFIPHLTIAKLRPEDDVQRALHIAQERWKEFRGMRRLRMEELTFVREQGENCWLDLAPVRLGANLVSREAR